jgi:ribosomal protein L11 methyltransferase
MKEFIQIKIQSCSQEESEILISELSENDFYAFVQEDSFGEQNENLLIAYINKDDFNEEKFKDILPEKLNYTYSIIEDRNWNAEWESNLQPIRIENFVNIRASFHEPSKDVEHEIIITPKMSFGTGHHATTYLMIEMMQQLNFNNKKVLDFGTGTGVLAILAEKLHASSVIAIDCDEWSINNLKENIEANNCKKIFPEKRDNIRGLSSVDIILANINLNVLQENSKVISILLQPCSLLLVSGILLKDEEAIVEGFKRNGLSEKKILQKGEWIALLFEKL